MPAPSPLLRLAEGDQIAVATRDIGAGEACRISGAVVVAAVAIPLGHKVALTAIAPGERVLKYRVPIGVATAAIAPGEWVHLHNLRSDYIPTYTLDADHRFAEE